MAAHNELGKKGEAEAVAFLKKNGCQILEQNYRFGKAEIDIICKEGDVMVFCEVKTRSTGYFGYPEEAVSLKKIKLIKRAAEEYIYQSKHEGDIRFDIISIVEQNNTSKLYHIKDAFFHQEDDEPHY